MLRRVARHFLFLVAFNTVFAVNRSNIVFSFYLWRFIMRSYETSRKIFSILEFFGWAAVVLGAIVVVTGFGAASATRGYNGSGLALMAIVPGLALAFFGLMGIAGAQVGRAGVDTAEMTGQMLKVARDQLQVSKDALRGGKQTETGFASVAKRKEPALSKPVKKKKEVSPQATIEAEKIKYWGKTIEQKNGLFLFDGTEFTDLKDAQLHIRQLSNK
jgi:hypothetical protein